MRQGSPKKVLILDQVIANQIAAGEVVERPYNAIKELIENAVDACANHILVEIEEGGLKLLRVVDDGYGMEEADACNAIQRHGTSKLQKIEDLQRISTLGFRGEALPSIVSISNFSIKTKTAQQLSATKLELQGGKQLKVSHCAGNTGTEIEARDLFFNVPARKLFQKSAQKESEAIKDLVLQQAICYPEIAFKLIVDGREVIDLPIQNHLRSRLHRIFGKEMIDHLHAIEYQGSDFSLRGYLSDFNLLYTSNRHFYTYVNDRLVKHQFFWQCLSNAYGARLPKGKYPVMALKMQLDGRFVDVNIHPNKIDVRFANEEKIKKTLENLFAQVIDRFPHIDQLENSNSNGPFQIQMPSMISQLLTPDFIPQGEFAQTEAYTENQVKLPEVKLPEISKKDLFISQAPTTHHIQTPTIQTPTIQTPTIQVIPQSTYQPSLFQESEKHQVNYIPADLIQNLQINEFGQIDKKSTSKIDDLKLSFKNLSSYKQIGLIKNRWWQVEGEDGVAMIDLGMARALLLMEKNKYQSLDQPIKIEFNPDELQRLQVRQHLLKDFGLLIQKKDQGFFIEQRSHLVSTEEVIHLIHLYLQIDQMVQAKERLIHAIAELSLSSQQTSSLISQLSIIDEIFYQKPMLRSYYRMRSILKYQDILKNQI